MQTTKMLLILIILVLKHLFTHKKLIDTFVPLCKLRPYNYLKKSFKGVLTVDIRPKVT